MKRSKFIKFASFVMTALMVVGLCAAPVFAADEEAVDVTATGGITIDASAVLPDADISSRTYNVYQILSKQIVGDDGQGNDVYQYKLTEAFAGFTSENFQIDPRNGAITTKDIIDINGTEYPAGTKLNATENNDNLANTNSTLASMLARELQLYVADHSDIAPTTTIIGGGTGEVVQGWYLITEGANSAAEADGLLATKPILVEVAEAVTLTLKDAYVYFDKSIDDPRVMEVRGATNAADYSIGDEITYKIRTNFPTYAANVDPETVTFIVRDNPSIGLTIKDEDIVVTAGSQTLTEGDEYTLSRNGNAFAITFDAKFVLAHPGWDVTVEYVATLNENAIVNSTEGNTNEGSVEYSTDPGITNDSDTLTDDEPAAYTYAVDFHKLDGAHATFLDGATFTLEFVGEDNAEPEEPVDTKAAPGVLSLILDETLSTDDLDVYRPIKEGETGVTQFVTSGKEIRFYGLACGTYKLSEIEAPAGYAKLSGDIEFTIAVTESDNDGKPIAAEVTTTSEALHIDNNTLELTAEGGTVTVDMKLNNYEGVSLPSTGAMTSILVMGAGAAVVGGGLFFALRKKKDEDEE